MMATAFTRTVLIALGLAGALTGSSSAQAPPAATGADDQRLADVQRRQSLAGYQRAIELARLAISENPRQPEMHFALGTLLSATGDLRTAIEMFSAELELNAQHFEARRSRAVARSGLGEYQSALVDWQECRRMVPDNLDVVLETGRTLAALGRLDEAKAPLQRAAMGLDNASAWTELGVVERQLGDYPAAEYSLRQALAKDPTQSAALFNLGQTLVQRGEVEKGAVLLAHHAQLRTELDRYDRYRNAATHDPSVANFLALAEIQQQRADERGAIESLRKVLELDRTNFTAAMGIAEIHFAARRDQLTDRWLTVAESFDPNPSNSKSAFLRLLLELKLQNPRAIAQVEAALDAPDHEWQADHYSQIAHIQRETGQFEGAVAAAWRAIELDRRHLEAHRELAFSLLHLGDREAAQTILLAALDLGPSEADLWMLEGIARYPGAEARTAFERALVAQVVELLEVDGPQTVKAEFITIAGSEAALALYADLAGGE